MIEKMPTKNVLKQPGGPKREISKNVVDTRPWCLEHREVKTDAVDFFNLFHAACFRAFKIRYYLSIWNR